MDHNKGTGGGPTQELSSIEERALSLEMQDQDILLGLDSGIDSGV